MKEPKPGVIEMVALMLTEFQEEGVTRLEKTTKTHRICVYRVGVTTRIDITQL